MIGLRKRKIYLRPRINFTQTIDPLHTPFTFRS